MTVTNAKPTALKIVAWISLLISILVILSGVGNLVAQQLNYGGIYEYGAAFQVSLGIVMFGSSVYLLKGNKKARDILEICLWLLIASTLVVLKEFDLEFLRFAVIAGLQFWIPLGLLIYGIRKKSIRNYVNAI